MTLQELRENPFAWPGGYRLLALMDDGETLCHPCLMSNEEVHVGGDADGWRFEDAFIHWEGPPLYCAHCNAELESECGDPEAEEERAKQAITRSDETKISEATGRRFRF